MNVKRVKFIFILIILGGMVFPSVHTNTSSSAIQISSWAYQLQNVDVSQVSNSDFELLVTDYSKDGINEWSSAEVEQLKTNNRIVLSYISIGEAEDYRYYWNTDWDTSPPSWLDEENTDWPGNYKVNFWDPNWQNIIYSYLDIILDQGFSGVYLDIIDAYEYYLDKGIDDADTRMIDFVSNIADYIRGKNSDFLIFPQNGEGLIESDEYVEKIDGIGIEDLIFLDEGQKNSDSSIEDREFFLDKAVSKGKIVITVDYISNKDDQQEVIQNAIEKGYIPYFTIRDLNILTFNNFSLSQSNNNSEFSNFFIFGVLFISAIRFQRRNSK